MAINPPSDIILDVAKAADPLRYAAAVEKLTRMRGAEVAAASFDLLLGATDPASTEAEAEAPVFDWTRADLRTRLGPIGAETSKSGGRARPYEQFEAFVLQTFVQSMLPKDANHVFGEGIAGSYWGSMLTEQVAGQVAKAGGIGIADELARSHPSSSADFDSVPLTPRVLRLAGKG